MRNTTNKFAQVFGLICPFTGKVRFIEVAKDANAAYEGLLKSAHLFTDPISDWITVLKEKGVTPGFALLDSKAADVVAARARWERIFSLNIVIFEQPEVRPKSKPSVNKAKKSQFKYMETFVDENAELTRDDSSEPGPDSE